MIKDKKYIADFIEDVLFVSISTSSGVTPIKTQNRAHVSTEHTYIEWLTKPKAPQFFLLNNACMKCKTINLKKKSQAIKEKNYLNAI